MAEPNFKSRTLFHSDNLPVLRGMNSESVHLIATDPPFNKGRDFHSTPDSLASGARFTDRWSWDRDVHEEWVDAIKDDWPGVHAVIETARITYGDDMAAFLCWLGVRLMEMRRVLRNDGSIYLHIDHTAHAYVKTLMDAVFGKHNFRNEIVWAYTGPSNTKRWFPRKHDTLLFYVKEEKKALFNRDSIRVPYHKETLARRGRVEGERSIISPSVETSGRRNNSQVQKNFGKGKVPEDWWADIPILTNQIEKTGFRTQKPLALYERIIKASSNEGDIVLDPFAGCATTPVAAERLRRQWVGIDIWEGAHKMVLERLQKEWLDITENGGGGDRSSNSQTRVISFGEVLYTTEPPERTDDNEIAAPSFRLKMRRPKEAWERLTHREMVAILVKAQGSDNGVICAGCGRVLEREFMELDHITPKSDRGENHILNRILLCRPCNGRKRDNFTLRGLVRENKRKDVNWMRNEELARIAQSKATDLAEQIRDNFDAAEYQSLLSDQ